MKVRPHKPRLCRVVLSVPGDAHVFPDVLAARRAFLDEIRDAVLRAVCREDLEPVLAEEFLRALPAWEPRR